MIDCLYPVLGNTQYLDGGAMFGHVPKTLWSQWLKPNENNQVQLATRALLLRKNNLNILFEVGIGTGLSEQFKQRYGIVESDHVLLNSLEKLGLSHHDIDYIVLSHLHFDHAGGLLVDFKLGKFPQLLFPNAKIIVSKSAWQRACNPHSRDKASFIPELHHLLESTGRLIQVQKGDRHHLKEIVTFHYSDGHTPGLLMSEINVKQEKYLFVSDLIPASQWIHTSIAMGYDRFPELLIDEKRELLSYVYKKKIKLFFTHDPNVVSCSIKKKNNQFIMDAASIKFSF